MVKLDLESLQMIKQKRCEPDIHINAHCALSADAHIGFYSGGGERFRNKNFPRRGTFFPGRGTFLPRRGTFFPEEEHFFPEEEYCMQLLKVMSSMYIQVCGLK